LVFSAPLRTVDRLIAGFLLRRVRRTWPLLNLVPSPLLLRLLTPSAPRVRQSLERAALWLSLMAGAAVLLIELFR
jgi:hypothetical protein